MDKETQNLQLPESPASVTARVITNKGFHIMFTLRDASVSNLIKKFEEFQQAILKKGWTPETNSQSSKGQGKMEQFESKISAPKASSTNASSALKVSNVTCAKCGAAAKRKSGYRKDGRMWEGIFCSTGDESHKVWLS